MSLTRVINENGLNHIAFSRLQSFMRHIGVVCMLEKLLFKAEFVLWMTKVATVICQTLNERTDA